MACKYGIHSERNKEKNKEKNKVNFVNIRLGKNNEKNCKNEKEK